MLFEIDDSAIDEALRKDGAFHCLQNLLHAHSEQKHIVLLDADKLSARTDDLSKRERGTLARIKGSFTELRGLRNRMKWRVRVGVGPTFNGKRIDERGKVIVPMPLSHFAKSDRVGPTVLLGEHFRDASLYEILTRAYLEPLKFRVGVAFESRLGGGCTTAPVFINEISKGRIVIAIVDSDRRHPDAPLGDTASAFEEAKPPLDIHHYEILHVRFAECLISSDIYEQAFVDKQQLAALAKLKQAEAIETPRWRDFADLKNGLTRSELHSIADPNESAFWIEVAMALGRAECKRPIPTPCGKAVKHSQCVVVDGLGRTALELATTWMSSQEPKRIAKLLGLQPRTPTGDLCEKLLAWGIAPAAQAA